MADRDGGGVDIDHLQRLVQLDLDDEQRRGLRKDLRQLEQSIEGIKNVDVEGVSPAYQPVELAGRERADDPDAPLEIKDVLEGAAQQQRGHISVPAAPSSHDDK